MCLFTFTFGSWKYYWKKVNDMIKIKWIRCDFIRWRPKSSTMFRYSATCLRVAWTSFSYRPVPWVTFSFSIMHPLPILMTGGDLLGTPKKEKFMGVSDKSQSKSTRYRDVMAPVWISMMQPNFVSGIVTDVFFYFTIVKFLKKLDTITLILSASYYKK